MLGVVEYFCDKNHTTPPFLHELFASENFRYEAEVFLKRHDLETNHLEVNSRIRCDWVTVGDARSTIAYTEGSVVVTVADFYPYHRKMKFPLEYPELPCVAMTGGGSHVSYYPLELVNIDLKNEGATIPSSSSAFKKRVPKGKEPAELHLFLGPMFAGKTSNLIHYADARRALGKRVIILTPNLDTRSSPTTIETHYGRTREAVPIDRMSDVFQRCKDYDVIIIDEVHLLPDVSAGSLALLNRGKEVLLAGLDGSLTHNKWALFPFWSSLIAHADHVEKMSSNCGWCSNQSIYTVRRIDSRHGIIGGNDKWVTLCRPCFAEYQSSEGLLTSDPAFIVPTTAEKAYWGKQNSERAEESKRRPIFEIGDCQIESKKSRIELGIDPQCPIHGNPKPNPEGDQQPAPPGIDRSTMDTDRPPSSFKIHEQQPTNFRPRSGAFSTRKNPDPNLKQSSSTVSELESNLRRCQIEDSSSSDSTITPTDVNEVD